MRRLKEGSDLGAPMPQDTPDDTDQNQKDPDQDGSGKLPLPPGVEPPEMGWPKWWYDRNVRKNKEDPNRRAYLLVPEPNDEEKKMRARRDFLRLVAKTQDELKDTVEDHPHAIILFILSKGNGATTTSTVWNATGLTKTCPVEVGVFDCNWASGTATQRLGRDLGTTINEREAFDTIETLAINHAMFNAHVRMNDDRIRLIAAKSIVEGGGKLKGDEYVAVTRLFDTNVDYVFIDTPNDIASEQVIALAGIADVLVFTANVDEPDSLRQLGTSMQTMRNQGLADKVNRGAVLISNVPPGTGVEMYKKYRNEVNQKDEVVRDLPGHDGPFLGLRHDAAIKPAGLVNWDQLNISTRQQIVSNLKFIVGLAPTKDEIVDRLTTNHVALHRAIDPATQPNGATPHRDESHSRA